MICLNIKDLACDLVFFREIGFVQLSLYEEAVPVASIAVQIYGDFLNL